MKARRLSIEIVTPAARGSLAGNRVTAQRWAKILRALGHTVRITTSYQGAAVDVLVALHARKSHPSIRRFRQAHPDLPLVVALTGTDVYRDIHHSRKALESLRMASRLVVLQRAAIRELPSEMRGKAQAILQSAEPRPRRRKRSSVLRLVTVGHLRAEKDPFRLVEALALLPELRAEALHAGRALEPAYEPAARRWMRRELRYSWLGELPAARARQLIADSDALVISSRMEGGANVISEAVVCGVPVFASRISSNMALLGKKYGGYFETGDSDDLARLIERFANEREFRSKLRRQVRTLQYRFRPRLEREAWRRLLAELVN